MRVGGRWLFVESMCVVYQLQNLRLNCKSVVDLVTNSQSWCPLLGRMRRRRKVRITNNVVVIFCTVRLIKVNGKNYRKN
jgi:hypothetical protein